MPIFEIDNKFFFIFNNNNNYQKSLKKNKKNTNLLITEIKKTRDIIHHIISNSESIISAEGVLQHRGMEIK